MAQRLRVKICGLKQPAQVLAIAALGVDALGFICVPQTPRYIAPGQIEQIADQLEAAGHTVHRLGVFADATLAEIAETVNQGKLTGVQLHGSESPEFCLQVRKTLPKLELIKAFRMRSAETLDQLAAYTGSVDTVLLDAYSAHGLGGTGKTWDWQLLKDFPLSMPWFLSGGLTPDNAVGAIQALNPTGIDLSSGVEQAPGDKDLRRVQQLLAGIQSFRGQAV
jgi:phosphoribosylanthranilate isomerase